MYEPQAKAPASINKECYKMKYNVLSLNINKWLK